MLWDVAQPSIVPLGVSHVLRRAALRQLGARWRRGRVDLLLPGGDTVRLGDTGPADARASIHDDRLFLRLLLRGEIGGGESYVAGEWSSDDLVGLLRVVLRATAARGVESLFTRILGVPAIVRHRRAANTAAGSRRNVHAHYDLGNAFYRTFLDETLTYSCAVWEGATTLADAQRRKLDRLCEWLDLTPTDHLLEIGCGWGSLAIHAAKTRRCRVTALTISREQHELAAARVATEGLGDRIAIEYRDYRELAGRFDKIVAVEMLEQVGYEYLPRFFATCAGTGARRLVVQTITMPDDRFDAYRRRVDWMQTYVFPGTVIPSLAAIRAACAPFSIARTDDIGLDYAPTLRAWRERFVAALPEVRALGFDTPFIRTWLLYLAFSEAAFSERTLGDHQLLFVR